MHDHATHHWTMPDASPDIVVLPRDRTVTDPVCSMSVTIDTARHVSEHGGAPHHFCSAGCKEKFELRPELYLDPDLRAQTEALCPALGMLLSPMIAALAMSLSSFSVIASALRLRASRLDDVR